MPTLGVFAAIIDDSERLLCVRLNYGGKTWTTPGGRVERGESPLDALRREVMEEVSMEIEPQDFIGAYAKPTKDDVVLFFTARVVARHPWTPNDEISELRYFGADELPLQTTPTARARMLDAFAQVRGVFRIML